MAWTNFAGYSGPGAQSPRAKQETAPSREPETAVLFRMSRDEGGEYLTAVFPCEPATADGLQMTCYAHIGQHSGCSFGWYHETRAAKPAEYADLAQELESIGYRLKVYQRLTRGHRAAFDAALKR